MASSLQWGSRNRRIYNERYEGNRARNDEIVRVPPYFKGRVIGKEHWKIRQIQETSGAFVKVCNEGFLVRGSEDERHCARKLIQEIVNASQMSVGEMLKVDEQLKGRVIGKGGCNIKTIREKCGAFVNVCADGFSIRGSDEQRELAKTLIQDAIDASQSPRSIFNERNDGNEEVVEVDEELKGRVIGRDGYNIQMIIKKSGAVVKKCVGGFLVRGPKEHRERARRHILQILNEGVSGELADIPKEYQGVVIGRGGQTLNEISTKTGAQLFRVGWEVFMNGPEEAQDRARLEIKRIVAGARNASQVQKTRRRAFCFVDDFNFPDNFELILTPLACLDTPLTHYRLQLNDQGCDRVSGVARGPPSYLEDLKESVLQILVEIKQDFELGKRQRNDMWCHFGTVVIENVDEADAGERDKVWTLEEISDNLPTPPKGAEENNDQIPWRTSFKLGLAFDETRRLGELKKPLYDTRHDLRFLTPSGRAVRCKIWIKEKEREGDEEKIPFDDVKNIIEEFHFRDERTNARCKAWLCLPSVKRLKAEIAFPACDFDCRLTIRTSETLARKGSPTDEKEDLILRDYLSSITLCEEDNDNLALPDADLPAGFYIDYRRCCRRSLYPYGEHFTIIVSKEILFLSKSKAENKVERQTDLHLHCNKWDQLLRYGPHWEPEDIVQMLPEFLSFVKKVQELIVLDQEAE